MKFIRNLTASLIIVLATVTGSSFSQQSTALDSEAIIQKIVEVETAQRTEIKDVVFEAEYIELEKGDDGEMVEKMRLEKTVTLTYLNDSVSYSETFDAFYQEGELESEEALTKIAKEKTAKKKKRGSRDISYRILKPFLSENRKDYTITYLGVHDTTVSEYTCHKFKVESITEDKKAINGEFYFDADSFQLVKVDFVPAKKGGNLFFKMKKLEMSMLFAPNSDGYWFPTQFDITGQGKAMFFIGVSWAGSEFFRNPKVNIN